MKKCIGLFFLLGTFVFAGAQQLSYTVPEKPWDADSLGNHRAVVQVTGAGNVARVVIPWRRRGDSVALKRIIVQDAATGKRVLNVKTGRLTKEQGELFFEPMSGKGLYYVYYMPYKNEGRANYPKGVYLSPDTTASRNWLQTVHSIKSNAVVQTIQSVDGFSSFFPMEVIATAAETKAVVQKSGRSDYLVFPEDRLYSIRMKTQLPQRWMQQGLRNTFTGKAARGEAYSFQLGVYALQPLQELSVSFSDLTSNNGAVIASTTLSCLNTSGTDYKGMGFSKSLTVAAGEVQPLWCLVSVPQNIPTGLYKGTATITAQGKKSTVITIALTVTAETLKDEGISEPEKQTRLHWLNSTLYQENTVIRPYIPLQVEGNTISLLGRRIEVAEDGFLKKLQTFFTPEMTGYSTMPNEILAAPFRFIAQRADGSNMGFLKSSGVQFTKKEPGTVQWRATSGNDSLQLHISASLEFDGFINYTVKLTALQDVALKDIALQMPLKREAATYLMGLGQKGGIRPKDFQWKWDVAHKNQDGAWIGAVNAGLQFSLRDEKYVRPLNTNFYLQKPLLLPTSWGNGNKGGVNITEQDSVVVVNNYSGDRVIKKGDTLFYNFTLLLTPFHPLNTDFQWANRFYHRYNAIDSIKETGATVINIHHATPINPWINYPFIEWRKMKAYIDSAHANGLKVKIYNTVREISNHAYETFALRSLGHEIYSPGKGGGFSWLQEHIGDDYIAAWFVPDIKDAAIVNSGMSRWHNYYVEGMDWLVQHVGIDGIYLDDVAFDRITMKRIKRALTADDHPGIIDLHSANQYNKSDGFNNSANLYLEHFPYLNRLWFGEYFDYQANSPDFFLTEVSGIPFGLMGEMLEGGGNPWRGMVYGMTSRMPWSENADPRPIWKVWDDFGMQGTAMIGYWSAACPVKTSNAAVLATVYQKQGKALISLASWATTDTTVQLNWDWKKLGIDSSKAIITAPEIKNFQPARTFNVNDAIPVERGKGWLLVVKEQ